MFTSIHLDSMLIVIFLDFSVVDVIYCLVGTSASLPHFHRHYYHQHARTHNHTYLISWYSWYVYIWTAVRSIGCVDIICSWARKRCYNYLFHSWTAFAFYGINHCIFCLVCCIFITNAFSYSSLLSKSPFETLWISSFGAFCPGAS